MTQQQPGRNIETPPRPSAVSPVDPKAWLAEARDHRRAGRAAAAEAIYRRIIAIRPADPEPRYLLGTLCTQTGRAAEAVEHLAIAARLAPGTAPLFNHLGHALIAAGRTDDAEAAF